MLLVPTVTAAFTQFIALLCSTSAHLAARMVYTAAFEFGDIEERSVLDLGESYYLYVFECHVWIIEALNIWTYHKTPPPPSTAVDIHSILHVSIFSTVFFFFQVVERVFLGSPPAFLEPVSLWGLTSILGRCQLQLKTPNRWKSIWTSCAATSHGTRAYQVNQYAFFHEVWVGLQCCVKSSTDLAVSYDLQKDRVVCSPFDSAGVHFFPLRKETCDESCMKTAQVALGMGSEES